MNTNNEDLRNLLRSADNHSNHSNNHELSELASLINSLDIDYTKPVVAINDNNDYRNNKHIDDEVKIMLFI